MTLLVFERFVIGQLLDNGLTEIPLQMSLHRDRTVSPGQGSPGQRLLGRVRSRVKSLDPVLRVPCPSRSLQVMILITNAIRLHSDAPCDIKSKHITTVFCAFSRIVIFSFFCLTNFLSYLCGIRLHVEFSAFNFSRVFLFCRFLFYMIMYRLRNGLE